jgi:hypothetical protein
MPVNFTPTTVSNPEGAQGSYPLVQTLGQEGGIADLQAYVSRSYRNQSGAVIPFGSLVMTDNDPTSNDVFAVELAAGNFNTALIAGIASEVKIFEGALGGVYPSNAIDAVGRLGYPNLQTVSVISKGVLWVHSVEAVALGDLVQTYVVTHHSTTPGAHVGRWGTTAVATKTRPITAGARWLSETAGPGLVLLEIDIPTMTFGAVAT